MIKLVTTDYVVLAAYFAVLLGIGIYFFRRQRSASDFFAGGRRIPWWAAGVSLYMANFSAQMYVGNAKAVYNIGTLLVVYWCLYPLSYLFGTLLTARQWRRTRSVSPVEFTRTRFNVLTQQIMAVIIIVIFLKTTSVQLDAIARIVSPVLEVKMEEAILALACIAILYSISGGLAAVAFSDVIQFVILAIVTLAIAVLSVVKVGGPASFVEQLPPVQWSVTFGETRYDLIWIVAYLIQFTLGTAQGQGQWFYSVRDERAARRVGFTAAALFLTTPILFCVPPLAARMLWPDLSGKEQDQIYTLLCSKLLPVGTMGLFLAAALSATLDNLSATCNLVSALVTRDIVPMFSRRPVRGSGELRIGRAAVLAAGAVVVYLAWPPPEGEKKAELFNEMVKYIGLLGPAIVVPVVLGLRYRRFPRCGALAAVIWALTLGFSSRFSLKWDVGAQILLSLVGTLLLCLLLPVLGGLWKRRRLAMALTCVAISGLVAGLFLIVPAGSVGPVQDGVIALASIIAGLNAFAFGVWTSRESSVDRKGIDDFFTLLETPVDPEKEMV